MIAQPTHIRFNHDDDISPDLAAYPSIASIPKRQVKTVGPLVNPESKGFLGCVAAAAMRISSHFNQREV